MRAINLLIFTSILMTLSTSANATNWMEIGKSKISKVSLNVSTLKVVGNERKIWARIDETIPKKGGHSYSLNRLTLNCSTEQYTLDHWINYAADGRVLGSKDASIINEATDIAPDSLISGILQVTCGLAAP